MEMVSSELVRNLIEALALVIISLLGYGAKRLVAVGEAYLDTKIGVSKVEQIKGYAAMVVRALEQSPAYREWDGAKKKEIGLVAISNYALKNHIPADPQFCDHVLEEAVQIMKQQQSPLLDVADYLFDVDPSNDVASSEA